MKSKILHFILLTLFIVSCSTHNSVTQVEELFDKERKVNVTPLSFSADDIVSPCVFIETFDKYLLISTYYEQKSYLCL